MKVMVPQPGKRFYQASLLISLMTLLIMVTAVTPTYAQCNPASSFTKITNTTGTATYPGTNGSTAVAVTTTSAGDVSTISFCGITNGFRAGLTDHSGSWRFAFSPAVNGISINLNALSNAATNREVVQIKINNVLYTVTAANIVCSANCFGCSGVNIAATGGTVTAATDPGGNGVGQLIIQSAGLISSIEYLDEVQAGNPQGSVFEIFFNNSTCILPVTLAAFTTSATLAGTQLTWTVASEFNVHYYVVERSTDRLNFNMIKQVPAINGGNYRYEDATAESGIVYYRLKIVDRDGSYYYSKTIQGTLRRKNNKMILVNPVTDVLTIAGLTGNSSIAVYTVTGKQLTAITTNNPTEKIQTANWPAGIYIVRIMSDGKIMPAEKVIKQ